MRLFKTPEKKRANYIYSPQEGEPIIIKPGMVGDDGNPVTEEIITILHGFDDDKVDANRREVYHAPVSYQAYFDGDGKAADDCNRYLISKEEGPLGKLLSSIEEQEHLERINRLIAAIQTLTPSQQTTIYRKFWQKDTNVQMAEEDGVTEAAIRNRLKKIYASLAKKMQF